VTAAPRVERRPLPTEQVRALPRLPAPGRPLTNKELAVLELVAQGLTNDEIGELLFYTGDTVKTMLGRILRKLGASNRAAAVDRGWRLGYLGDDNVRRKG
jgi:DNA-binding NarL/FixJ family response regulator